MARGVTAVVEGNIAYFMHRNHPSQVCSYDSSTQRWNELPTCPYEYSCLAIIRGLLTAVGGHIRQNVPESKLLSIMSNQDKKWVEHFPPMPIKRSFAAAITTKQHLIVAGGELRRPKQLDAVAVMNIETLVWSTAASLPHPYSWASATICGDHLYMLGGLDKNGDGIKSVLTCSVTELLQSRSETLSDSVWHRITDVPMYCSTCAAVNGELVAVGGQDAEGMMIISSVYKYNTTTDSWDIISNMPTARSFSLVAVLPTNEMMVVGGFTTDSYSSLTDKVERVYTI